MERENLLYDVLVIGGTLEACIAAAELAGKQKKVLLTEESGSLGGMATNGMDTFLDMSKIHGSREKAYAEKILKEAGEKEGICGSIFHDQKLKLVLKRMLEQAGVTVLTHVFPESLTLGSESVNCRMAVKTGALEVHAGAAVDGTAYMEAAGSAQIPWEQKAAEIRAAVKCSGVSLEEWRTAMSEIWAEEESALIGKLCTEEVYEQNGISYSAKELRCCYNSRFGEAILSGLAARLPVLSGFTRSEAQAGLRRLAYRLRDRLRKRGNGWEKLSILQVSPVLDLYGARDFPENVSDRLFLINRGAASYSNAQAIAGGIKAAEAVCERLERRG